MEEKNKIGLREDFEIVLTAVKTLEQQVSKHEQLLLTTFSYLYNRIDEISKPNVLNDDLIDDFRKDIDALKTNLTTITNDVEKIKKSNTQQTIIKEIIIKDNKQKRKRPWNYFFIKRKLYNELLIKKHELEAEIDRKHQELLQKQKEQEELIRKQEELRQKELEEKRLKRRKESQQKINEILTKINKK